MKAGIQLLASAILIAGVTTLGAGCSFKKIPGEVEFVSTGASARNEMSSTSEKPEAETSLEASDEKNSAAEEQSNERVHEMTSNDTSETEADAETAEVEKKTADAESAKEATDKQAAPAAADISVLKSKCAACHGMETLVDYRKNGGDANNVLTEHEKDGLYDFSGGDRAKILTALKSLK